MTLVTPFIAFKNYWLKPKYLLNRIQLNALGAFFITVGLVVGSYFTLRGVIKIFATANSSITVETDTQFNQGTFSITTVSGSGNGAVAQIASGGFKRTLTFNNADDQGLVGYWTMDESEGAAVADTSGSGNNGTATGTTIGAGQFGSSRIFNGGNSDKVTISTTNRLPLGGSPLTVSVWFKITDNYTAYQSIFSWGSNANGQRVDFFYDGTTGKLGVENCNASSMFAWVADSNWHHIVVVVPGNSKVSGQQIYLDGILKTGVLGGTDYQLNITAFGPYIGALNGNTYYLTGAVDEARIYNRTLSSTEVTSLYTDNKAKTATLSDYQLLVDEGEVGYWKMDEASGSTVTDISGYGISGISTGTSITTGKWGNSRIMTGSNQYINVINTTYKFNYNQDFSVAAWVYKEGASVSYATIFAQQSSTSGYFNYSLQEDGNGNICANVGRYMVASYSTCAAVPLTTWTHVAMTYSNNTVTLYINGSATGTAVYPGNVVNAPNSSTYIGNDPASPSNRWWNGRIDEVRIYNRALSAAEMSFLYTNNQSPLLGSVYASALESGTDLNFKDEDDSTVLPFYAERFTAAGQNAKIYIKVPSISANTTKNINIYYGGSAVTLSNGANTFLYFDDSTGSITDKWTVLTGSPTHGTYQGRLATFMPASALIASKTSYTGDFIAEAGVYLSGSTILDLAYFAPSNIANTGYQARFDARPVGGWGADIVMSIATWAAIGSTGTPSVASSWRDLKLWVNNGSHILNNSGVTKSAAINSSYTSGYFGFRGEVSGGYFNNFKVRKYAAVEPPLSALGAEVPITLHSGTWESASNANVMDTIWNGGWGDGSDGSTAFSATVANVDSNNTITFEMRTATSASGLSTAEYKTLGIANSGTTFAKTKAELDALGVATGINRYIQVKATFTKADGNPQLDNFTINYLSDNTAPEVNATGLAMLIRAGGGSIAANGWTNELSPYFSWTAASDSQSLLKGYCLYLGTDSAGNPATSKGMLGTSPVSTTGTTCQFIVTGTSIDFATASYKGDTWITNSSQPYYLNIRAIDNNNNITSTSHQISFHYDITIPNNASYISCASGNFSNVVDMNFSWPTSGGSAANDANAGIGGWQYQINSSAGTWQGTTHDATFNLDYIPATASAYTLVEARDGDDIVSGANVIYFRSVDAAGNVSNNSTVRTCNLSYGGAAPTFGGTDVVTVTPSTALSNSYALSWPEATASGSHSVSHYYYMVNTTPPSTLATLQGNAATYVDNGTSTTVAAGALTGANKGSNTVYVVAIDDASTPDYSPSNYISGTFTLNSSDPDNVGDLVSSDSSIKSQSQWNVTLTWTAPSYQGAGNLTYLVYRSTDGTTFSQVGSTSGLSYVDNTPTSALYYYKVYTKDGANAQSSGTNAVSITPTGKWTSAPSLDSGPDAGSITTKKASITWSTSRSADSKIQYGTSSGSYSSDEVSNSSQVASHTVNLTNLTAGTTYYYRAKWTDEDGNTGTSDEESFTTQAAPTVKNVTVKYIGLSSAVIDFTSNGASSVKMYYGTSTSFGGLKTIYTASSEASYSVTVDGLLDGTKYYFKLNSLDSESSEYQGTILDFTTLPRPKVTSVRLQEVVGSAQPSVLVTWQSNTEISSIVTYYPEGAPENSRDEVAVALTKGEHRIIVKGLLPDTNYILIVKGRDKIGNEATSDTQRFTTATDTRPPQITDIHIESENIPPVSSAAQSTKSQLIVSWNTDELATSQIEYGEGTGTTYPQKTQEDSDLTFNHLVIITDLSPSKVYHLRVLSKDKADNLSQSIDRVTITPKATDNALNLVISNLQDAFGFLKNIQQK